MPMASWIAWLKSCTPLQAMRAPLGCGLQTRALPAASMLMALPASVGSECVTGVMTPMTPNGAYSSSVMPFSPLKASVLQELDAGDAVGGDDQLLDLVRRAGRSSSPRTPRGPAARPARCRSCGCRRRPCGGRRGRGARTRAGPATAAATASSTSSKTPQLAATVPLRSARGAGRCACAPALPARRCGSDRR